MQEQSALEVLHCIVTGEVKSNQSCLLSCVYAKLLSLSQQLGQTQEQITRVESQQVFAELRTNTLEHQSCGIEEQLRKCDI